MTTDTITQEKRTYLDAVASHLADIPEDDRNDILTDLETHLSELDDNEIEARLGTPERFASEFLESAGLEANQMSRSARFERFTASGRRLAAHPAVLRTLDGWSNFRPAWVAIRGWILVSVWAMLVGYDGWSPIPRLGSLISGPIAVLVATLVSYRIAGRESRIERGIDRAMTVSALGALLIALLFPTGSGPSDTELQLMYAEMAENSGPLQGVNNIYAFDQSGESVSVFLFDQDGQPIRLFDPEMVALDESNENPRYWLEDGSVVTPHTDRFGRPVFNLYPLDRSLETYNEFGEPTRQSALPPVVGIPDLLTTERPTKPAE